MQCSRVQAASPVLACVCRTELRLRLVPAAIHRWCRSEQQPCSSNRMDYEVVLAAGAPNSMESQSVDSTTISCR